MPGGPATGNRAAEKRPRVVLRFKVKWEVTFYARPLVNVPFRIQMSIISVDQPLTRTTPILLIEISRIWQTF